MPKRECRSPEVPIYEFVCPRCSTFDASYTMAEVPDSMTCPGCQGEAVRRMTAPRLSIATTSAYRLVDATKQSADAPQVVSSLPGTRTGPRQRYTSNPLHQKLPRP
jgi:putative FmdB family regulatory protein